MIGQRVWILAALLVNAGFACGQKFEITPLVGARLGGSIDVQREDQPPEVRAHLGDSITYGVAAGFRFYDDTGCADCSVVEFRWMRQNTNLGFKETTPVPTPLATFGRTDVTLDHYLADFTYEWKFEDPKIVRPFVMASLGIARLSTPASGHTRFTFGFGTGVKIFPQPHWGIRLYMEYLPMVMQAEVQRIACVGGCVVALGGGVMNQFEFGVGPVFRF
jgi:hypothetical protein